MSNELIPQEIHLGICDKHRDDIRRRIEARGWGYLISPDDETGERRFQAAMDPKAEFTRDNFDPLIMSGFAINHVVLTTPEMVKRLIDAVPHEAKGEHICSVCKLELEDWIDPALQDCAEIIDGWKKTDN